MASGKSEEDLLKEIAEKIVKNQISFKTKTDEEKEDLVGKIDLVATSQMGEVQKSFNALMENIEVEISGDARISILEGIVDKVEEQNLKSIDSVFLSEEVKGYAVTVANEMANNNDNGNKENDNIVIFNNDKEAVVSEDNKQYMSISDIHDNVKQIKEIFDKLDRKKLENIIDRAKGTDKKAKAEVMAIMSVAVFTKTSKSFEEMTENDRVRALTQLNSMAILNEDLESENLIIIAEELSKKWGVEFISVDKNGKKIIDREKIHSFAKENNIDYGNTTLESIYRDTDMYQSVKDFDDLLEEVEIEAIKINMNSNLDIIYQKIKAGEKLENYSEEIRKMLNVNFDSTMQGVDEIIYSWSKLEGEQTSPECFEYQMFLLQEAMKIYINAREGKVPGAIIDENIENNFNGMLDKAISIMKKNGTYDKKMLDFMLEIEPKKTQKLLEDYDFSESDIPQNENQTEKPKTKLENLINTLNLREKIKGIENLLQYTNDVIGNKNTNPEVKKYYIMVTMQVLENRENSYEEEERMGRKQLFTTIISQGLYDENTLEEMVKIDSTAIKEMIDEMIEKQNLQENNKIGTIMDLSKSLKKSAERKIFSADNFDIGNVAKKVEEHPDEER